MTTVPALSCGLLLVLTGLTLPAAAESFGTLFTTPEQRVQLDNAFLAEPATDTNRGTAEQVSVENIQPIRLNGILTSNRGKKELWINGQPASTVTPPGISQARVVNDSRVTIQLNHTGASQSIKPGQLYLPSSGEIQEAYVSNTRPTEE